MGDHRKLCATRGLLAALFAAIGTGGCVAREYAGIPLTPGAAPADLQALAMRARVGDKWAQFDLGQRYETGDGVALNIRRAIMLYTAAATARGGSRMAFVPTGNGAVSAVPFYAGTSIPGHAGARARLLALQTMTGTSDR